MDPHNPRPKKRTRRGKRSALPSLVALPDWAVALLERLSGFSLAFRRDAIIHLKTVIDVLQTDIDSEVHEANGN